MPFFKKSLNSYSRFCCPVTLRRWTPRLCPDLLKTAGSIPALQFSLCVFACRTGAGAHILKKCNCFRKKNKNSTFFQFVTIALKHQNMAAT